MRDRTEVLKRIRANIGALLLVDATTPPNYVPVEADATTLECIALLQSLMPSNPERDDEAQAEMAAEHNARADAEAKACAAAAAELTGSYSRGCWTVPTDALNNHFRQAWIKGFRYAKGEP